MNEAFGGEVRTLSPVREIVVRDKAVRGVVLEDGTEVAAPLVISNADYTQTVRRLVDPSQWDPATLDWLDRATMTVGLVCVYVVVDVDLSGPNTNYFVFPTYETDELYGRLYAGEGMDPEATADLADEG